MLVAIAFLCAISASDCEREASARAIVGHGATPTGYLMDGQAGAAAFGLVAREGEHLIIACRRKR